jgi:hypothetical protein
MNAASTAFFFADFRRSPPSRQRWSDLLCCVVHKRRQRKHHRADDAHPFLKSCPPAPARSLGLGRLARNNRALAGDLCFQNQQAASFCERLFCCGGAQLLYSSIRRNHEGCPLIGLCRPRAYHTRDLDPKWSDWHVGVLLASVIHPDAVTVGDERRREVSREFHLRVWLRVRFLGHVNSLFSLRPRVSRRALAA